MKQELQVELLQEGPHGDLIVGCTDFPLKKLKERETEVLWLDLKVPGRSAMGAQLCLVLR